MKTRFNTYDIVCSVSELQKLIGMRVHNVYDIDNKTYLIRLQRTEEKCVLLLESGNRFHTTAFEWPKNVAPSGFSMKMRKHLRNKRLESFRQLGMDRIVDLQFGSGEAAYHVILELYDRGNIILTDYELTILNILRPHTEGETVRFAVKEKYPTDRAKEKSGPPTTEKLDEIFKNAKQGDNLKKILNPHLEYGPAIIEHVLLKAGFSAGCKLGKGFDPTQGRDLPKLVDALKDAEELIQSATKQVSKGYIIQKKEEKPSTNDEKEYIFTNQEFHPYVFAQHESRPYREFASFDVAVDEFFSSLEGQKIDMKALHQEREAMKKLDNVKKDHQERLTSLKKTQEVDKQKAELITRNQGLVDSAILAVQSALASQISWPEIETLVKAAQDNGDPVASSIKQLKLETNHITMLLCDPYASETSSEDDDEEDEQELKPTLIDIDLALSAFANATRYYDQKRNAAKKQQRTIESHGKAIKSAEKKTKQTLKEVQAMTSINKARKVYWFEKFYWFVSSENYLIIGGRDQQQNELIVKRYMKATDIYVHADIHGASSVIIKNPTGELIPPKTLNEAGVMAICYSVAWEAKVITSAWWVNASQVSKTAPTGEYLSTGSFMVRGKKNYLPPCHLIMGFSFLFKLEDGSVERHCGERKIKTIEEDELSETRGFNELENIIEDTEVNLESDDDNDCNEKQNEKEEITKNATSDSEEENTNEFPDTQIKIEHISGTQISVKTEDKNLSIQNEGDSSEHVIFLGDDKPIIVKPLSQRRGGENKNKEQKKTVTIENEQKEEKNCIQQVKRGQKSKLKKIKEKYKDQDEEERRLRMEILQSAGSGKESKKSKKQKEQLFGKNKQKHSRQNTNPNTKRDQPQINIEEQGGAGGDEDEAEEKEEINVNADVDMIDSLTGNPFLEDELLFAVPVVAPYNTLVNYKYKVKLTPGTGKRGKAARTAISMFLRDKAATQREKDLLRSVKDENVARNLPGKVKLSAPKLLNLRK